MTDYFADLAIQRDESCVVVCNNGGAQRGHTVVTPTGERHVFHHFGSGTMVGAHTYLSPYFIVNPMIFEPEYYELTKYHPRIIMSPDCLCSTPYDMIANQILEESRGDNKHGSCGVGIWETIVRNGQSVIQMAAMGTDKLNKYLLDILEYYLKERLVHVPISKKWFNVLCNEQLRRNYIEDFKTMIACTYEFRDPDFLEDYDNIIFENGQGLLLDQNSEDKIHSTPSNTGSKNIYEMLDQIHGDYDLELCYVTRSYITRHGAGPFKEECPVEEIAPSLYDETNVWNKHQGVIRYGKLDFDALYERCRRDAGHISIAMTQINKNNVLFEKNRDKIKYASYTEDRTGVKNLGGS